MISLDDIMAFQEHAAFDQRAEIIESVCGERKSTCFACGDVIDGSNLAAVIGPYLVCTCAGIPPLKVNIHE